MHHSSIFGTIALAALLDAFTIQCDRYLQQSWMFCGQYAVACAVHGRLAAAHFLHTKFRMVQILLLRRQCCSARIQHTGLHHTKSHLASYRWRESFVQSSGVVIRFGRRFADGRRWSRLFSTPGFTKVRAKTHL